MYVDDYNFTNWNVLMHKPHTGDDFVDSCVKTLAQVIGSEGEAKMRIYSVLVGHFYIKFGAILPLELAYKLNDLPTVQLACPDAFRGLKSFGGQVCPYERAGPYDHEYDEECVGYNARANERDGHDDQPCNFDRSRNFEGRENMQNRDFQAWDMAPVHDEGMQNPPRQGNMPPPDMGGGMPPPSNFGRMPLHKQVEHTLITSPSSSLNELNLSRSDRHTEEAIFACIMFPENDEVNHWLVIIEEPVGNLTKDEIIDIYIETLARVVGSEEEARKKIYYVEIGPYYFAFAVLASRELAYNLIDVPGVRWVVPDTYLHPKIESYLNGQAVPYDPEYHEEWVGNNARDNERDGRDDRPCNFDRSRNFERRENMQNRDFQAWDMAPVHNEGMQNPPPQGNMPPPDMGDGMPPPSNFGRMPLQKKVYLFVDNFRMCTYDELLGATEGFSPDKKAGEGAFGSVCKGTLIDGTIVAIKVSYRVTTRSAGVHE